LTASGNAFYNEHVLPEEDRPGTASLLVAGATAIAVGVAVALVAALGAPEAAPVGHLSVFVGMALSLAGIVAGRSPARDQRVPATEVRRHAHR
jgi:hypothetical protein